MTLFLTGILVGVFIGACGHDIVDTIRKKPTDYIAPKPDSWWANRYCTQCGTRRWPSELRNKDGHNIYKECGSCYTASHNNQCHNTAKFTIDKSSSN